MWWWVEGCAVVGGGMRNCYIREFYYKLECIMPLAIRA